MNARQAYLFSQTTVAIDSIFHELREVVSAGTPQFWRGTPQRICRGNSEELREGRICFLMARPTVPGRTDARWATCFHRRALSSTSSTTSGQVLTRSRYLALSRQDPDRRTEEGDIGQPTDSRARAVIRRASTTALPYRDGTVDAVVCDPHPLRNDHLRPTPRTSSAYGSGGSLRNAMPDLFGGELDDDAGLQDKSRGNHCQNQGSEG